MKSTTFVCFGFPCFINIEFVALVPVMYTGNCQFILQGLQGCFNTLISLQDRYRVELLHREIPVVITGNGFAEYIFFCFGYILFPVLLTFKMLL